MPTLARRHADGADHCGVLLVGTGLFPALPHAVLAAIIIVTVATLIDVGRRSKLHETLQRQGVTLHFSEIKGPAFDRLKRTKLIQHLSGKVYLSA